MKSAFFIAGVCILALLAAPAVSGQTGGYIDAANHTSDSLCKVNSHCAPWDYCRYEPGMCGGGGICTWRPEGCAAVMDPVCGCDGHTYSNSCVAAAQGVSIAYAGMCEADDADHDLVYDFVDNCLGIANSFQFDTDNDLIGNACDPDVAPPINDCVVDFQDLGAVRRNFLIPGYLDTDFNSDGITDEQDLAIMKPFFFKSPGPSALSTACELP